VALLRPAAAAAPAGCDTASAGPCLTAGPRLSAHGRGVTGWRPRRAGSRFPCFPRVGRRAHTGEAMGNASSCVCDTDGLLHPSMRGGFADEQPSAPDITMMSVTDGSRTTLREFLARHGCDPAQCAKPTVLQFYATWDASAHKAADQLEELAEAYGADRINFVHICVDGDGNPAAAASRFHQNHALGRAGSFHFFVDAVNDRLAGERYDIHYLPHRVIIGRDGTVEVWECTTDRPDLEPYLDERFRGRSLVFGTDRSYDDSYGMSSLSASRGSDRSAWRVPGGSFWRRG
jgi:thiol-disulfide isomerase/thioredoxin